MLFSSALWTAALTYLALAGQSQRTPSSTGRFSRGISHDKRVLDAAQMPLAVPKLPPVLDEVDPTTSWKTATLQIEMSSIFGLPLLFTNIAIGTPPQPFRLMLDFTWGGVGVRGIRCGPYCGDRREWFSYNRSASSTSSFLNETFDMSIGGQYLRGDVVADDLQLAAVALGNVSLGDTSALDGEHIGYIILVETCDGLIGLAPPNATSLSFLNEASGSVNSYRPNLLHGLTTTDSLAANVMTLTIPEQEDEKGTLVLGKRPTDIDFTIPLANKATSRALESTWNTRLNSITLNGTLPLSIPTPDTHMAITAAPDVALRLHGKIVDQINQYLGAKPRTIIGGEIDCEIRESLPDLILDSSGTEVVLTWKDYSEDLAPITGDPTPLCVVNIMPLDADYGVAASGLTFMKKFDLSFDMENEELGFKLRK